MNFSNLFAKWKDSEWITSCSYYENWIILRKIWTFYTLLVFLNLGYNEYTYQTIDKFLKFAIAKPNKTVVINNLSHNLLKL